VRGRRLAPPVPSKKRTFADFADRPRGGIGKTFKRSGLLALIINLKTAKELGTPSRKHPVAG